MEINNYNNDSLHQDFCWLKKCVEERLTCFTKGMHNVLDFDKIKPPAIPAGDASEYGRFVLAHELTPPERLFLLLALAPHADAGLYNSLLLNGNPASLSIPTRTGDALPTGKSLLFLLAGSDIAARRHYHFLFETVHLFYKKSIIDFGEYAEGDFAYGGVIKSAPSWVSLFLYNKQQKPRFSADFPAHLLETELGWDNLILNESSRKGLEEIKMWLAHKERLRTELGLGKHLKNGYRVCFFGPSGTGKTLAATLLGKHIGTDVYRVDLSTVVSKYIGETSKNLGKLFDTAEDKGWILFFDEGDSLFSKRQDSGQTDKNTHYANQEISYLLQRIEHYNGLVILATNFEQNIDDAFSRRFESAILFNIPNEQNRLRLWKENLPQKLELDSQIDLDFIAKKWPVPAATIINIINRISLICLAEDKKKIQFLDLQRVIHEEVKK